MTFRILIGIAGAALLAGGCGELPTPGATQDAINGRERRKEGFMSHSSTQAFVNDHKVFICHVPPGNPGNMHVIEISERALNAHINKHGDSVCTDGNGDCCPNPRGGSVCTNLSSDVNNCGACGTVCNDNTECSAGRCLGGVESVATTTSQSSSGGGSGGGGGSNSSSCGNGRAECNGACIDILSDRDNCGACGAACAEESPGCSRGVCMHQECSSNDDCGAQEYCDQQTHQCVGT